jgi:hypothetical protein
MTKLQKIRQYNKKLHNDIQNKKIKIILQDLEKAGLQVENLTKQEKVLVKQFIELFGIKFIK